LSGADPAPAAATRPPGALRALGTGLRLAHFEFLRLYPLALLVGVALELVGIASDTANVWAPFNRAPVRLVALTGGRPSLLRFATFFVSTFGWLLPVLLTTAVVAHAVRARVRGETARPLASLRRSVRALHIAVATALAFSIVPLAALWIPTASGNDAAIERTSLWVLPLSVPLAAGVVARWLFAVPCAVLERRGLIAAWRRSERLGAGRQLATFGLVVLGGATWLVGFGSFATFLSYLATQGGRIEFMGMPPSGWSVAGEFGRVAIVAWFHLCVATVTTVYFERVRFAKEGPDADELRSVFN
jgi:hypothetical protein